MEKNQLSNQNNKVSGPQKDPTLRFILLAIFSFVGISVGILITIALLQALAHVFPIIIVIVLIIGYTVGVAPSMKKEKKK